MEPKDYCQPHASHVVYRPSGGVVWDERTDRQRLVYKPYCATQRYWDKEQRRCAQYHTGHRTGQCECVTAGCMVDERSRDCVPYDPARRGALSDCEVNRGVMTLCAQHMPGRAVGLADWRESCLREAGVRCRLDGDKDIACVPNHDPNGRVDVPPEMARSAASATRGLMYASYPGLLAQNEVARMRDPLHPSRWIRVAVEKVIFSDRGERVQYRVYALDDSEQSVYTVDHNDLRPEALPAAEKTPSEQRLREIALLSRNLQPLVNRLARLADPEG